MEKFKDSGKNLTLDDIKNFEQENGIKLTELYTKFMLENNGGCPKKAIFNISDSQGESCINDFLSIGGKYNYNDLSWNIEIYNGRMPDEFIPIADDPVGNAICLGLWGKYHENIFFWDHELECCDDEPDLSNMHFLAPNIYEFVENLYYIAIYDLHPQVKEVRVELAATPNRPRDCRLANESAGLNENTDPSVPALNKPPHGYIWHHKEDGGTMVLVEKKEHAEFSHQDRISPLSGK